MRIESIALALVAAPVPAMAASTETIPVSIEISYSDLDLTTEAGADVLRNRLTRAAVRICRQDSRSLKLVMHEHSCRKDALTRAKAEGDRAIAHAHARASSN